jgi:hypothetical protein
LFLGWRFYVRAFVDGVVLPAFDWVEKDFGRFLYAFEEGVVFRRASRGAFVRVMAQDFLAVGGLDL